MLNQLQQTSITLPYKKSVYVMLLRKEDNHILNSLLNLLEFLSDINAQIRVTPESL